VALLFIGGGLAGGLIGASFAQRLAAQRGALQRVFAYVIFAVAAYMLWRTPTVLHWVQAAISQ
jgi:hypothetical protein